MKILVVTPVHKGIDYLTQKSLDELDIPDGYQIDYFHPRYGYPGYPQTDNMGRYNLLAKYQQAREICLSGKYDYMLTVEEDNLIPSDTIQKLLACDSDVAYGLYVFGRMPLMYSCWVSIDEQTGMGFPLSSFPMITNNKWGSIVDCDGVGFGCTLIKSDVLAKIPFRVEEDIEAKRHNDIPFAIDCINAGFTQRCNLDCLVGHIKPYNTIGLPSKSIIMPSKPTPENYRCVYSFVDYASALAAMKQIKKEGSTNG